MTIKRTKKGRRVEKKSCVCVCVCLLHFPAVQASGIELIISYIRGIKMTLCHMRRKCSLPERAAENIPHTWQHWLKIAQKLLIHHCKIFAQQARDPRLFRSRFDVCNLVGHLTLSTNSSVLSDLFPLLFLPLFWGFWWILSSRKAGRTENPSSDAESHPSYSSLFWHMVYRNTLAWEYFYLIETLGASQKGLFCVLVWAKSLYFVEYLPLCIINITHIHIHYSYIHTHTYSICSAQQQPVLLMRTTD